MLLCGKSIILSNSTLERRLQKQERITLAKWKTLGRGVKSCVGPVQCTCHNLLQSQLWLWPQGPFTVCFNYILHMTRAAVRILATGRSLVTTLSVGLPLQFVAKLANTTSSPVSTCLQAPLHIISGKKLKRSKQKPLVHKKRRNRSWIIELSS